MVTKPIEARIQDVIYNVDVGIGQMLIRIGLYVLGVLAIMLLYTGNQFHSLKDAAAMDAAQLGRNLAQQHRFTTLNIRPASLWLLAQKRPQGGYRLEQHPDIVNPPLWPLVLAAGFRVVPVSFDVEKLGPEYRPEKWVILPLSHLFTLLTGLVLFFFAQSLFDRRVGVTSTALFYLSDLIWRNSISGTGLSLLMFLVVSACYAAYVAVRRANQEAPSAWGVRWPVMLAGVLCGLAFLTRYSAGVFTLALAVYLAVTMRRGWRAALLLFLVFAACVAPWIARNLWVSRTPLGLTPYLALNETQTFPDNLFERTLQPVLEGKKVARDLYEKFMKGLARGYRENFAQAGDGPLLMLFVAALFYRFANAAAHRLRWCLMIAVGLLWPLAALYGAEVARILTVCWPFFLTFGVAFFFILLDRLQLPYRLYELLVIGAVYVTTALPLVFSLLPPRVGSPYPPYFPPFVIHVSRYLRPTELMCTDMPWATAWYGQRPSLLLPSTIDTFYEINDLHRRIYGLYFTTLTRNKAYVRDLLTGPERSWFPILEGRVPGDFPLNQGFPLSNLDQLFLTLGERLVR